MIEAPSTMVWDGASLRATHYRVHAALEKELVVGQAYRVVEEKDRSAKSHAHYFAVIEEMWASLPEFIGDRFPSSEHLRKYALIKAGYSEEKMYVAPTKAEALRIAAFIKPLDGYALVTVKGTVVRVYTARTQSMRAMGSKDFQASKTAVLEVIEGILGIKAE